MLRLFHVGEKNGKVKASKNVNSSEGKTKPKKSGINDPVLNQLAKLYKEKFPEKKPPNIQIVKDMIKRHKEGESLENIINSLVSK